MGFEGEQNMTKIFNKKSMQEIRRKLRNDMTFTEKVVWLHIRKKQLGVRFLRQYSIDNYVIDFYCPALKLALEIDGAIHLESDVKEKDEIRENHIAQYGIRFLRITNEELYSNPNKTFQSIEREIKIIQNSKKVDPSFR